MTEIVIPNVIVVIIGIYLIINMILRIFERIETRKELNFYKENSKDKEVGDE